MYNNASYYSIAEVATNLGLSIKTIRRHIASGELDSAKIGNVYRIPKCAVEEFINSKNEHPNISYDLFGEPICATTAPSRKNVARSIDRVNWADISTTWNKPTQTDLTFVDLFCGAGGLSKVWRWQGCKVSVV